MTTLTPPTAFFIGAFEVPAHIVTPAEVEEQRRQQEEQAAKEARSKELKKARYEKRKAEKREFTARKKAGLLTPGGTGSRGKTTCTQPGMAKGMAGETQSRRAAQAA